MIKWLTLCVEESFVSFSCYNKCKAAIKHSTPNLKWEFLDMKITRPKAIYASYRRVRHSNYALFHLSTIIIINSWFSWSLKSLLQSKKTQTNTKNPNPNHWTSCKVIFLKIDTCTVLSGILYKFVGNNLECLTGRRETWVTAIR